MRRPSAVGKIAKDAGYCTHCRLLGLRLAIVKHLVELHTGIKGASRYQHPDQFGYCGACLITPPLLGRAGNEFHNERDFASQSLSSRRLICKVLRSGCTTRSRNARGLTPAPDVWSLWR